MEFKETQAKGEILQCCLYFARWWQSNNTFSQWFWKREACFHSTGCYTPTHRYSVWKIIPKTVRENYWRDTTANDVSRNTCSGFSPNARKRKVERSLVWPSVEENFGSGTWCPFPLWYTGTTSQYFSWITIHELLASRKRQERHSGTRWLIQYHFWHRFGDLWRWQSTLVSWMSSCTAENTCHHLHCWGHAPQRQ